MSNKQNDIILERAQEMVEVFEGKLPAKLILNALDSNDLDLVKEQTAKAEGLLAQQEMNANDCF